MSSTACDDQFNDPPIETSNTEARPYVGGTPENIRAGDPYDDPAFERLAREHDVWGRAESALCAVFWLAGKAQPPSGQSATPVGAPDRIFLVIDDDVPANTPFSQLAEVTWCAERVNDTDIEYVRAQPAAATAAPSDALLQRHLDLLQDVLDAKQAMRAAGCKQDQFSAMFREYAERYGQAPAASAEPYAWMIDGSNRTWFGKFSEIEARAEARRCGGTCTAFPIFRGVQPAASAEPVPVEIERLAINRYRPVPAGALAYKVVAGDGSRSLFSGTKDECQIVARKLTEAFLDGAHVAINAAPVADQAPQDERMETTSEHIARDIREGRFPQRSEPQRVQATEWGPMPDAGVEADAHVAVIEGDEAVRVLRWNSDVGAFSYPVGTRLYAAQAPAADGDVK
ncbi:hypothetical protein N5K27_22645 [Pigmentiphaga sp. GD03639]|uniref:hypothetical protein n=1 Tax=Pigmentiphaga sp. GD03639 TaxID=2975354 RepID=UPI00244B9D72|nr:hypothetical protein [Pigmentiphaga sp. GD03639]MDH2239112.1 hypothetical protein [Pigmentiphaga sp. GD03639]